MKIILPNERPMSWNKLYAGTHWTKRNAEAARVHSLVKFSIPQKDRVMFKVKVNIFITAYFDQRSQDSDNIADKFYIDGLRGVIIEDDNRKFVGFAGTKSEIDKENPRVEIEIIPALNDILALLEDK